MADPVLRVQDLAVHFEVRGPGTWRPERRVLRAVDGVSFELDAGETLGVVGESGCGKSTLARAILGLVPVRRGRVMWLGEEISALDAETMRTRRSDLQIVFQDPLGALDPRMTVGDIIAEPLLTHHENMARVQVEERVRGMMKLVGLLPNQINRYPHEFSGGQCQRIGIARALVLNPRLIICDEPVSALDVSVQAQIVNLLRDLQRRFGLSLVFIGHDLSVVRHVSDRVLVMYMGRAMEVSRKSVIYRRPLHPYTSALIRAVPVPDPKIARARRETGLTGDMPSPLHPPGGCPFHTRCPYIVQRCRVEVPPLRRLAQGDWVACHRAEDLDLTIAPTITPPSKTAPEGTSE